MHEERTKHASYYNKPKSSLQIMSQVSMFPPRPKDHAAIAHEAMQQQKEAMRLQQEREKRFPAAVKDLSARSSRTTVQRQKPIPVRLSDFALNPNNDATCQQPKPKPKEVNRTLACSNGMTEIFAPLDEMKDDKRHTDRRVWPGATKSNRGNCLIGGMGEPDDWKSTSHSFNSSDWGTKNRASSKKSFDTRDPKNMVNPLTNQQFGWPEDAMAPKDYSNVKESTLVGVQREREDEGEDEYYDDDGQYGDGNKEEEYYDGAAEGYDEYGEESELYYGRY